MLLYGTIRYYLLLDVAMYIIISYYMLLYAIIRYYMLLYRIICYYMLLYAIVCCYVLPYGVICYYMLLNVIICYYILLYVKNHHFGVSIIARSFPVSLARSSPVSSIPQNLCLRKLGPASVFTQKCASRCSQKRFFLNPSVAMNGKHCIGMCSVYVRVYILYVL